MAVFTKKQPNSELRRGQFKFSFTNWTRVGNRISACIMSSTNCTWFHSND